MVSPLILAVEGYHGLNIMPNTPNELDCEVYSMRHAINKRYSGYCTPNFLSSPERLWALII